METVPAKILNEIASSQKLKTEGARRLFRMNDPQKAESQEAQYQMLLKSGNSHAVAMNYQELAPLMAENEAISRYIQSKGDPSLRMILPEICSPEEAMRIADRQRPMNPMERMQLAQLLTKLEGRLPDAAKRN